MLYASYDNVRLEKGRINPLVEQTDQQVTALTGAPTTINRATGTTTNQLSVLVPSWEETGDDTIEQLAQDWDNFANAWDSFYTTGVDQTSTLWFPSFPDGAEWAALMQYEAGLAALQKRINAFSSVAQGGTGLISVVQAPDPPPAGPGALGLGNLFPWLTPDLSATLTNAAWVAGLGYFAITFGPAIGSTASALAPRRKSNPRRARRRRR